MLKSSNSRIVSDVNHVVVLVIKLRLQQNASESFSNHHAIRFPVSNSSLSPDLQRDDMLDFTINSDCAFESVTVDAFCV